MKTLLAIVFATWTSFALAQTPAAELPKPGTKDLCPVCGMLVSKYPNWVATIVYKDGHAHFFNHKGHTKVLPVGELPPIERKDIIAWKVQYTAAERLPNELKTGQLDLL